LRRKIGAAAGRARAAAACDGRGVAAGMDRPRRHAARRDLPVRAARV